MSKAPKPYPSQFKREAIELVRISGRSIPHIAGEIGGSEQFLPNWVAKDDLARGAPEASLGLSEREELKELRKENKRLRMEREILKQPRPSSRRRTI